jgi:FkbM family methyltransferase
MRSQTGGGEWDGMNLQASLVRNFNDVRHFGPAVLLRHDPWHHDRRITVHPEGVGHFVIRGGDSDVLALRQVFVDRQYDLERPRWLRRRITDRYHSIIADGGKPIIVDAGANIGAASLWFSSKFPDAHIVAIEPDPENVAVLRENLADRANTVVMEAAIGGERGHVAVQRGTFSWGVRTERSASGVPVATIADAFAGSGGDTPFIVKVDIEGFEEDLFAGNVEWIDQCYAIFVEPDDWMLPDRHSSRSFQQAMARYPFKMCIRGENLLYVHA